MRLTWEKLKNYTKNGHRDILPVNTLSFKIFVS
jgi:hypothetical protein